MKNFKNIYSNVLTILAAFVWLIVIGCQRSLDELEVANFPVIGEVFIDDFSPTLDWGPFLGSKATALEVTSDGAYEGSGVLRFEVPVPTDPDGSYMGGVLHTSPRNLSSFNVLTFYARASMSASINEIGFGLDDEGKNDYQVTVTDLVVNTNWKKYYIPIPDASKLVQEEGMFWISEGAEGDGGDIGYTIWIDEVQFENIPTLVDGIFTPSSNQVFVYNGEEIDLVAPSSEFSSFLPNVSAEYTTPDGGNISFGFAPSYLDLTASDADAFTFSESTVTVNKAGIFTVSGDVGGVPLTSSLQVTSLDFTAAPTPTAAAEDVISVFSDTYTNVSTDFLVSNFTPFQTTTGRTHSADGDNVIIYSDYNFVGISVAGSPVDATDFNRFHASVFVPGTVDAGEVVTVALESSDGSVSSEMVVSESTDPALVSGSWIEVDTDISNFAGRSSVSLILFRADADQNPNTPEATVDGIVVDNIYFYKGEGDGGGSTGSQSPYCGETIQGQGNEAGSEINASVYFVAASGDRPDRMRVEIESADSDPLDLLDLPAGLYTPNTEGDVGAYPVESSNGVYTQEFFFPDGAPAEVDGFFFQWSKASFDGNWRTPEITLAWDASCDGGSSATEPTTAAPTPTEDAANVISVFSDQYTDISGVDTNPNWGQATVTTTESIESNSTLKLAGLNYQGIDFDGNRQDVSGFDVVHIDYWTANSTALNFFLIGPSAEAPIALTVPTNGEWTSLDIPLSDFTGIDLAGIRQMKFDGNGDIWIDNIYFSKTPPTEPTTAAPTPTEDAANVISIFSDQYTDISGVDTNPNWGQATVTTTESIESNSTLKLAGLNYQGIDFDGNRQDVSGFSTVHIDYWTANSTALNFFLIGPSAEAPKALTVPTNGEWTSVDIPLSDFTGIDLTAIRQMKIDGNGDIWIDNIYFSK